MEMFDKVQNQYIPTVSGLGMHVEIRDPDDRTVLSRVRAGCVSDVQCFFCLICTSTTFKHLLIALFQKMKKDMLIFLRCMHFCFDRSFFSDIDAIDGQSKLMSRLFIS